MHTALEAAVQLATFPKAVVDVFVLVLEVRWLDEGCRRGARGAWAAGA